jgi:hypothetical protein
MNQRRLWHFKAWFIYRYRANYIKKAMSSSLRA